MTHTGTGQNAPGARLSLTILIPTFNEESNICEALASASFADEILVVDSFSTDRTVEIARAATNERGLPVRVLEHEYINSATQKNWAIPQAANDWVMVLDADERIPAQLRAEIEAFLAAEGPAARGDADGLRIRRLGYFLGHPIRHSGWQKDSVLRVFPRDRSRYLAREVHADVVIFPEAIAVDLPAPESAEPGKGARIIIARHKMLHYTFISFEQYMRKFNQYTTWAAGDRGKRTRKVTAVHLLGRPVWRFFRQYVLDRGFLDGRAGLVVCMLAAFSVFLKYAKLWERQENERALNHQEAKYAKNE